MLRAVYVDLEGGLLGAGGSLFHDGEGAFTMLGARALEACARAEVEVVPYSGRPESAVVPDARVLGLRSYLFRGGRGLVLDGERERPGEGGGDPLARGVAAHMRARAYAAEECIAVAGAPEALRAAEVVGTVWLVARGAMPALSDGEATVRVAEAAHGAGVYEAVITELAERR